MTNLERLQEQLSEEGIACVLQKRGDISRLYLKAPAGCVAYIECQEEGPAASAGGVRSAMLASYPGGALHE